MKVTVMSKSILRDTSREFAKDIVLLCRKMKEARKESVIANQILRSGTSIGANIHEAQYAHGPKDFALKFEIALKECHETEYWLDLIFETESITKEEYDNLRHKCGTIRARLISSLNTIKSKYPLD